VALYASASTILLGSIYYALPRITGKAWLSGGLVRTHLVLTIVGIVLLIGSLSMASVVQSQDLLDPKIDFGEIALNTRPWLGVVSVAQGILLLASMAVTVNFVLTACRILNISEPAVFNPPSATEAHAP